jgi:phage gp36-like protein
MDYCTQEDLETHLSTATLIQLTSDDGANVIDSAVALEAIIYASTLINGYLRGRYSLPLNSPLPLLRIIAIDIAVYRLYSRRMRTEIPDVISNQYNEAIKRLQDIQKGIITLENVSEESSSSTIKSGTYICNKTKRDKVFNKVKLSEY